MNRYSRRRDFLIRGTFALVAMATPRLVAERDDHRFRSLFNGKNLDGWKPHPRVLGQQGVGKWIVKDGMIVGAQDPPKVGSYLVSEETFADFELQLDAWPDWPADTGVYVRTNAQGDAGFQVLIDYRRGGAIGGYYGNQLGRFISAAYAFTAERDQNGKLLRLVPTQLAQPPGNVNKRVPLDYAAPAEEFLRIWKLNTWNTFRIRSVGAMPHLTTWINGVKISELDTAAKLHPPILDPAEVLKRLGRSGHIALEVHSNGPKDWLGMDRWAPGSVCRWRNICIRTL